MFHYRAFGLRVGSAFALPELAVSAITEVDVVFLRGKDGCDFTGFPTEGQFLFSESETILVWPELGCFRIADRSRVVVDLAAGADPELLGFALLGPVMALVLQARKAFVLHGSALAIGGQGIAFLGDKGAGKSTTAASLVNAGHELLTDDILALSGSKLKMIQPAFAQVKLSSAAASVHRPAGSARRPAVMRVPDKDRYTLAAGFSAKPTRLRKIYLLATGSQLAAESLPVNLRFKALLRFSYVTRFGPQALDGDAARRHLDQCTQVAETSDIAILTVPRSLERLGEIASFLLEDLRE